MAHAGEEGGPDYVREALDELHVERVDHGVRAMEDPELVARLRAEQIPLTVCPLSNVALRVVGTLGDHMLPGMLDAGLLATVNSDDPAYFGGYVDDNLAALRDAFGYDDARARRRWPGTRSTPASRPRRTSGGGRPRSTAGSPPGRFARLR